MAWGEFIVQLLTYETRFTSVVPKPDYMNDHQSHFKIKIPGLPPQDSTSRVLGRDSGGSIWNKLLGWYFCNQSGTSSLTDLYKSLINSTAIYSRCLLVWLCKKWHSSKICSSLHTEADAFTTAAVTCNAINTLSPAFTSQICVSTLCCQWICVQLL